MSTEYENISEYHKMSNQCQTKTRNKYTEAIAVYLIQYKKRRLLEHGTLQPHIVAT